MNIAVIIAGGSGSRMGQDIPKQFINVYDKPVIVYTMEAFQRHPMIDAIEVVCLDGWHDILRAYAKQYGITKLKWVMHNDNILRTAFIFWKINAVRRILSLCMTASVRWWMIRCCRM